MDNIGNLDQIKDRIVQNYHPDKIILFGSYAKGTNREGSDIDLLVVLDHVSSRRVESVRILSTLSDLSDPVDIIVCSKEELTKEKAGKYSVIAEALEQGNVIYEKRA